MTSCSQNKPTVMLGLLDLLKMDMAVSYLFSASLPILSLLAQAVGVVPVPYYPALAIALTAHFWAHVSFSFQLQCQSQVRTFKYFPPGTFHFSVSLCPGALCPHLLQDCLIFQDV